MESDVIHFLQVAVKVKVVAVKVKVVAVKVKVKAKLHYTLLPCVVKPIKRLLKGLKNVVS